MKHREEREENQEEARAEDIGIEQQRERKKAIGRN